MYIYIDTILLTIIIHVLLFIKHITIHACISLDFHTAEGIFIHANLLQYTL